jgi:hypothetical protein
MTLIQPDLEAFALLVESLTPWRDQAVIIGGWAHRLHRLHASAQVLDYPPLTTLDADVALPSQLKVDGQDIYQRLTKSGFQAELLGDHKPPATHYHLTVEGAGGFYAEFLTPLIGSTQGRGGKSKGTTEVGGVVSQNLRYVDLLLHEPWTVVLSKASGFPFDQDRAVLVASPVSFVAQKVLVHSKRSREDRAKDTLYIHDTLEAFGARLADLRADWQEKIGPQLNPKARRQVEAAPEALFEKITDAIREAARVVQARTLSPERIREVCKFGMEQIFRS